VPSIPLNSIIPTWSSLATTVVAPLEVPLVLPKTSNPDLLSGFVVPAFEMIDNAAESLSPAASI
jgi:hypothetical protein